MNEFTRLSFNGTYPPPPAAAHRSEQKPVKSKREGGKKSNGEVKRKNKRI
jgi:hypothetical protein